MRTIFYWLWAETLLIALLGASGYEVVLANQVPILCNSTEGVVKVGVRASEMLLLYEWTTTELRLVQERNLQKNPLPFPHPFKQYGGDIQKWNQFNPGVAQSLLGPEFRLDAPFDISSDGNWLVSGIYPAHGNLSHSPTDRFAIIQRGEKHFEHVISLPHSVTALSLSPSGKRVALLIEEDVTENVSWSLRRWFARIIGHPIPYSRLLVAFYDRNGEKECEHLFHDQSAYGGGYLEWLSE